MSTVELSATVKQPQSGGEMANRPILLTVHEVLRVIATCDVSVRRK